MNVSIMNNEELVRYTKPVSELETALHDALSDSVKTNEKLQESTEELNERIEELNGKLLRRESLIKDWIYTHRTILNNIVNHNYVPNWLNECMDTIEFDYKNSGIELE